MSWMGLQAVKIVVWRCKQQRKNRKPRSYKWFQFTHQNKKYILASIPCWLSQSELKNHGILIKVFFTTWSTSQLSVNCFKSVCCPYLRREYICRKMAEKRQGPTPGVRLGEMSVKREVYSRLFARGYANRLTVLNELKILFTTYIDLQTIQASSDRW